MNNFAIHNLALFHSNLFVNLYTLSKMQSNISKYKLKFEDRNYRLSPFHVNF